MALLWVTLCLEVSGGWGVACWTPKPAQSQASLVRGDIPSAPTLEMRLSWDGTCCLSPVSWYKEAEQSSKCLQLWAAEITGSIQFILHWAFNSSLMMTAFTYCWICINRPLFKSSRSSVDLQLRCSGLALATTSIKIQIRPSKNPNTPNPNGITPHPNPIRSLEDFWDLAGVIEAIPGMRLPT